jgi:hypothetical protein
MAAGSTLYNGSLGTLEDAKFAQANQTADGSVATAHAAGAIWNFKNCSASGTTTVKTGAGRLHMLICGTASGNVTIYDNTTASGTKILDTCALAVGTTSFDVAFGTGLTVVLSGAGVATVTYL